MIDGLAGLPNVPVARDTIEHRPRPHAADAAGSSRRLLAGDPAARWRESASWQICVRALICVGIG